MRNSDIAASNLGTVSQSTFDRLNPADYPGAKVFVIGSAGALTEYSSLGAAWKQVAPFSDAQVTQIQASVSGAVAAPATLDASNAASYNGVTVNIAAAATMTVHDGAWALLPAGVGINVGQGGSATMAFSGTATKENASGASATSVTLAASGVYALLPSPTGSPRFRLSGGASL